MLGHYKWMYAGSPSGFDVALRPNGLFYSSLYGCGKYEFSSDKKLAIDWKKYGKYEFNPPSSDGLFQGGAVGDASQWRNMQFVKPFDECEQVLMGEGGIGTEWNFEWQGGSFPVEFHFDAHNHFVCKSFPAHSHWALQNNQLTINWDKYGVYEMVIDASSKQMQGCKQGQPTNWRKASLIRPLSASDGAPPSHDHAHVHTADCGH